MFQVSCVRAFLIGQRRSLRLTAFHANPGQSPGGGSGDGRGKLAGVLPFPLFTTENLNCNALLAGQSQQALVSLVFSNLLAPQATREVEALVFQMTSGVAQLKRLVDALGTPKDTVDLR